MATSAAFISPLMAAPRRHHVSCHLASASSACWPPSMMRAKAVLLRAAEKTGGFSRSRDSGDGGKEVDVRNDALRDTIMKSKRVLAVHKELLQKIAERRKMISAVDKQPSPSNDPPMQTDKTASSHHPECHAIDNSTQSSSSSFEELFPGGMQTAVPSMPSDKWREHMADNKESGRMVKLEGVAAASAPLAGENVMNVIVVAAECAPWSKTGGLGDVVGALPKALARRGHRVMVMAPRYAEYAEAHEIGERRRYNVMGQDMEVIYYQAYIDGVDFVFLDNPIFHHLENNIYGGDRMDILRRIVLLCKAAVEAPWHVPCGGFCYGDGNLIFIANDWHTALLPVYLKAYYHDNGLMIYARSILVIHNIAHQGRGPVDDFSLFDLPSHYVDLFKLYDPIGGDHSNIFAAGIRSAYRVVAVSRGYAQEIATPEGGVGLHGVISDNSWKLEGIVNGIDMDDWDPQKDVHLQSDGYVNYSVETVQTGKAQCKAALQRELGLPVDPSVPVLTFIGRLDHQKGVDLIAEAMPWIAGQRVQLILLGSGRPDLEDMLRQLESQHYNHVRGWVGFSVRLAHRMTAGADVLLMPSRFEPCGLNQMYAMRYGTVPVVHAVGGLRDTVSQFNPYAETGVGWTFQGAEANRMIDALGHCLNTYRNFPESWEGIRKRGMNQELGWDHAAELYEAVLVAAKYQW